MLNLQYFGIYKGTTKLCTVGVPCKAFAIDFCREMKKVWGLPLKIKSQHPPKVKFIPEGEKSYVKDY